MALGRQWTKVIITAAEWNFAFACALPTKNLKFAWSSTLRFPVIDQNDQSHFARTTPGFCVCTYIRFSSAEPNLCLRQALVSFPIWTLNKNLEFKAKPTDLRLLQSVLCLLAQHVIWDLEVTQTTLKLWEGVFVVVVWFCQDTQLCVRSPTLLWAISFKAIPAPPSMVKGTVCPRS